MALKRWPRWASALVEIGVAAAILLTVAFIVGSSGGSGGAQAASASQDAASQLLETVAPAPASWSRGAMSIVSALAGDLTATERDTAAASTASPNQLVPESAQLARDIETADRLPFPPGRALGSAWRQVLSQLTVGTRMLGVAAVSLSPAAVLLAHQQLATAGDELLLIGQVLESS